MSKNKTLADFEEAIRQCVKCGLCQAHCPVYQVDKREGTVARGKIMLAEALLDGDVDTCGALQKDISMCLMCGSCVDKCPNKVPTDEIVGAIRREITDNHGLSLVGKGISTLLASQPLMKGLSKGGSLVSPLVLKKVPGSSGLRLRFPSPVMRDRTLPKMPFTNLFDRLPEFIEGRAGSPVVGFFAGCSITYIYPEIGEQMVNILKDMGFSVFLPRSQRCCGIPALSSGDGRRVEGLAAANTQAFAARAVEHIITACASCNGGIGEYYASMKTDMQGFTDKVVDFNVFLERQGLFERLAEMPRWQERKKVTYHDPCHLKKQGITAEPRAMLQALPNVDFVEMDGADRCCGLGGTFSAYHYEESKKIGAKKIEGLVASGATHIATACPGCIMQLQDTINHAGLSVKAVHVLQLFGEAVSSL
ncbi:MAG: lactate dehydrogenase [Deltaproteobacteria bacterium]|nr:MAG: lactate dehydrogenase [Deltaproteobacteria bacterium]